MDRLSLFWERLLQDLKYGLRMLGTKPGFTAVAVLSIALGIGATTAIFSVVYAVLIDPYPYRAADRIGQFILTDSKGRNWGIDYTMAQYLEFKSRTRTTIEDAVAVDGRSAVMTGGGLPDVVQQEDCSLNMFDFFGVPTLFGRAFSAKDAPPGHAPEPVAVISYKFWQRAFQGRRDVVGEKIRLDDKFYTVIGVLPVRFTWNDIDAYTPMDLRPDTKKFVSVFYRARAGASQQQIGAEAQKLLEKFAKQVPAYVYPEGAFRTKFVNVNEGILGKFENTLLALFGAVTLLLLIACVNVANLLLARAATREGEMAIRASIGATRFRLVRQLLTESVTLALSGGVLGILLGYGGIKAVISLMPEYSIPHEAVIALNWPVLWFALGVSVLTGIIFGMAPALQISGETQTETLRGAGKGSGIGVRRRRLHDSLMIAEVVLSLVLLTGAGLAVGGLMKLLRQNLGYDPSHVLTFRIPLAQGRYADWSSRRTFYQNILARLRRSPDAEAAAISILGTPPYNGGGSKLLIDGRPLEQGARVRWNLVSDGYFRSVRTPLLRGRELNDSDVSRTSPVAVVTEDFVKRYFRGNEYPIGRHIEIDILNQPLPPQILKAPQFKNSFEIVGVVGTARNNGLSNPPEPAVFIPYTTLFLQNSFVFVRTKSDPMTFLGQAREAIRSVDAQQPITLARTLEDWLNTASAYPRFATFLFGVFGAVGLFLAAAGVFSVVSYAVAHRTREFGIRMALGARPSDVLRLVILTTGRVLAIGVAAGLALSVLATRLLAGRMEGMGTADPYLFVSVPLVLTVATLLAYFLPAQTATQIQPMEALRHE